MASNSSTDGSFDPSLQQFNIASRDGTAVTVSIGDLNDFNYYSVKICINYAAQLGASFMLMIALIGLTQKDKKQSPLFLINVGSLIVNFIRLLLLCLYYAGSYNEVYTSFTGDLTAVAPIDTSNSVGAIVLSLVLVIMIQVSLFLQSQVVCVTLKRLHRLALAAFSAMVGAVAVVFRFIFAIGNIKAVLNGDTMESIQWIDWLANATLTVSIGWFCLVFVGKLGHAIWQRRKLGLNGMGAMDVIFIMGCQTLVIPLLFALLQFIGTIPAANSNVLTAVAIFLPLSSVWASYTIGTRSWHSAPSDRQERTGQPLRIIRKDAANTGTDSMGTLGSPITPKHAEHNFDIERQRF